MKPDHTKNRRKILIGLSSGIIGASQLPKSWSKPVIDSVILPTHAETTDDTGSGGGDVTTTTLPPLPTHFRSDINFDISDGTNLSAADKALSLLIQEANAGFTTLSGDLCIDSPNGSAFTAQLLILDGGNFTHFLTASGTVNGGAATLIYPACRDLVAGSINVTDITAAGAAYTVSVTLFGTTVSAGTLPPNTGCPADPGQCNL